MIITIWNYGKVAQIHNDKRNTSHPKWILTRELSILAGRLGIGTSATLVPGEVMNLTEALVMINGGNAFR